MAIDPKQYLVRPGSKVQLQSIDPEDTGEFDGDKDDGKELLEGLTQELETLQEHFYAAHKNGLLMVLQGMDTSGKDGTVRHVFDGVNPLGVRVASFKAPTPTELEHDFLWRVHQQTPARGEIVIFNRSHYEDVLVVRVKGLVPEKVWSKRFEHIYEFEKSLADEGTVILKFFLHISKQEQKQRLIDRLEDPEKHWKFNPGDIKERDLWDNYMHAYEDAIQRTSTDIAPWYIIPADRKWFRNLVIATILVDTLKELDTKPAARFSTEEVDQYKAQLG